MRIFYLIMTGFTCLISLQSYGQDNEESPKSKISHEIGINASYILTQLIGIKPDSATSSPYLLTYRTGYKNWGFSFGFGGRYKYSEFVEEGFADSKSSTSYALNVRLGLDYRLRLGNKFSALFGIDGIKKSIVEETVDDSGFDKIIILNQYHAYGFGPRVSLEYWITPHLSITTEAMFYLLFGSVDNGRTFENFPELNDNKLHYDEVEFLSILPASIFLKYQF